MIRLASKLFLCLRKSYLNEIKALTMPARMGLASDSGTLIKNKKSERTDCVAINLVISISYG
jgi:hypothetical protein